MIAKAYTVESARNLRSIVAVITITRKLAQWPIGAKHKIYQERIAHRNLVIGKFSSILADYRLQRVVAAYVALMG